MVIARRAVLVVLVALAISCSGGGVPEPETPGGGTPRANGGGADDHEDGDEDDGATCSAPREVEHPTHRSDRLRLEFVEMGEHAGMVIPPFEFEAVVDEDLAGSIDMELTIHDPAGRTHTQRFSHRNMQEVCDPICDPAVGGPPCPPRRCWMQRFRPRPERIDHTFYRSALPGIWTYVLRRLDDGDRVSVSKRLFEGEIVEGEECEMLPLALGAYRRESCRRGVVPMGSTTNHWGITARYTNGNCRVNAFALPLDHMIRTAFTESPYAAAGDRELPEGTVKELVLGPVTARAWMAHHHAYIVAARNETPGYDRLVRSFVQTYPVVGGPVRPVPSCEDARTVIERTVAPVPLGQLEGNEARFVTHFEGNRPSGVVVHFHDQHPLALAGLRRNEILHTVDGERVPDRRAMRGVLERMTRPGRVDVVVSRERVTHSRCIRLRIAEGAQPVDAGTPDAGPPAPLDAGVQQPIDAGPPQPQTGRHCVRRSDECWDCADIRFPAEIGCTDCRGRDLCVTQDGQRQCLAPVRVCCQPGTPCNVPPGCDGAASSCASDRPGPRQDRCTFLSACATPLPRSRPR